MYKGKKPGRKSILPWIKRGVVKVKEMMGKVESVPAESFSPHTFNTKIKLIDESKEPKIIFLPEALKDMYYVALESGNVEASWLGIVKKEGNNYIVTRIIIFNQKCSFSETELDRLDIAKVAGEIMDAAEDGIGEVNDLKLWGHIHHHSTTPSGQDDTQMKIFENGNDWFIRIICNRQGKIEVTFYDYRAGIKYEDTKWLQNVTINEGRRLQVKEELKSKIIVNPEYEYSGHNAYFQYPYHLTSVDDEIAEITEAVEGAEEFIKQ